MKGIFTKKVLVIISVVSVIVLTAVVLSLTMGRTYYPSLSDPNGVFYQRVDDDGNVLYEITNQDLFEEIKSNDGIQQLLFMVDSMILSDYINEVTEDEIDDKILELTYGTSDPDALAEISDDVKADLEVQFEQSMILAGFPDNPEDYAKLIVAREKFAMDVILDEQVIDEIDIVKEYLNRYFKDIQAIKIRFTSAADALAVLEKFNLVSLSTTGLREYNGYIYNSESLKDPFDEIVEAYTTIDTYYFDENDNILDTDSEIIYTIGYNDIYTDADDVQYRIQPGTGDLVDGLDDQVIPAAHIFDTLSEAESYKEANSEYYVVTRTDPYDMNETIEVINASSELVFTIDPNGHIWDTDLNDVTYTTDLIVNKVYKPIEDVSIVTLNNSTELSDEEVLEKFIEMYNYVYGLYRDALPSGATVEDLVALDNEYLQFNYEEDYAVNPMIPDFMFSSLSIEDGERYTYDYEALETGGVSQYYLIYKLTEPQKEDVMDKVFDSIEETIIIPTTVGSSITLPTSSYYESTISWTSSDTDIISKTGAFVAPKGDVEIDLTYTITALGRTRSNTITVTALAAGETVEVTDEAPEALSYRDIVNDPTAFNYLEDKLYNDYIYGTSGESNVEDILSEQRALLGFQINDYYLALDYINIYSDYVIEGDGDRTVLASLDSTLNSEEAVTITADDFFEFAIAKNAALYTLYASQFQELLHSPYFEEVFGTQTNLQRNNSDRMAAMYDQITQAKEYYSYLLNIYAQYGMTFTYSTFSEYSYSQFGAKTELALLEYFVSGELQPYLIYETIEDEDIINAMYPFVMDYYDNYFSLNVVHVLAYVDFDEDGSPDDFEDFKDQMTQAEIDAFTALQARLETAMDEFEGTFDELVTEYNNATREDETWGEFKQNGFMILTEDLNVADSDTQGVTHSLTYSGDYGVKDSFDERFVEALIDLYDEYQLPQNADISELYSGLVETQFGLHLIEVSQGDDFDKPSFAFTEEDSENPEYSVGVENPNDTPTLEQLELYSLYKFYTMVYDLSDADVEETYGITVPSFPTSVKNALDTYFGDLLTSTYVLGVININMTDRLSNGEFVTNSYLNLSDTELMAMLQEVGGIYYEAIFGDYVTE